MLSSLEAYVTSYDNSRSLLKVLSTDYIIVKSLPLTLLYISTNVDIIMLFNLIQYCTVTHIS